MRNLIYVFYPGDEDFAEADNNVVFILRASCAPSYVVLQRLCVSIFKIFVQLGLIGTCSSSYEGSRGRQQVWQ